MIQLKNFMMEKPLLYHNYFPEIFKSKHNKARRLRFLARHKKYPKDDAPQET